MSKKPLPKYPGLRRTMHRKTSREFVDYDYLDKLSDEEKAWLEKFSQEYYRNVFSREEPLTPPGDKRREQFAIDNARRRDMWSEFYRMRAIVDSTATMDADEQAKLHGHKVSFTQHEIKKTMMRDSDDDEA